MYVYREREREREGEKEREKGHTSTSSPTLSLRRKKTRRLEDLVIPFVDGDVDGRGLRIDEAEVGCGCFLGEEVEGFFIH